MNQLPLRKSEAGKDDSKQPNSKDTLRILKGIRSRVSDTHVSGGDTSPGAVLSGFTSLRLSYLDNPMTSSAAREISSLSPTARPCHNCYDLDTKLRLALGEVRLISTTISYLDLG